MNNTNNVDRFKKRGDMKSEDYKVIFDEWNNNRVPLTVTVGGEEFTYIPDPKEYYVQCFKEYCEENKGIKFLKARSQLRANWFASNFGNVISVDGGGTNGYHVSYYAGQMSSSGRLQIRLNSGKAISRESLISLCFPGFVKYIDPDAAAMIEEDGLDALGAEKVECHHTEGHIPFDTFAEGLKLVPKNCDLNYLELTNKHNIINHVGKDMAERLASGNATTEDLIRLGEINTSGEAVMYIPSKSGLSKTGTLMKSDAHIEIVHNGFRIIYD